MQIIFATEFEKGASDLGYLRTYITSSGLDYPAVGMQSSCLATDSYRKELPTWLLVGEGFLQTAARRPPPKSGKAEDE